jgi:hypothetical protein
MQMRQLHRQASSKLRHIDLIVDIHNGFETPNLFRNV